MRNPGHGKQFAHLLEADLYLSTRDHGPDPLTSADQTAFACCQVGNSQALIKFGGDILAADTGRVADGFRLQERAFQTLHRVDVRHEKGSSSLHLTFGDIILKGSMIWFLS